MEVEKIVQETFRKYRMSSVQILKRIPGSVAVSSGFVIGKGESFYLVMTNRHCVVLVGQNPKLSVRFSGKTIEYEAEELYHSETADVAIIKVKGVPADVDCPVLTFGDSENIAPKADIVQLGYVFVPDQLSLNPSVAPGIFVSLNQDGYGGIKVVVYTAAARKGISGSAVLLNFKVIGVTYSVWPGDQMVFAVSSNTIQKIMKTWLQLPSEDGSTIEQMINTILAKI